MPKEFSILFKSTAMLQLLYINLLIMAYIFFNKDFNKQFHLEVDGTIGSPQT